MRVTYYSHGQRGDVTVPVLEQADNHAVYAQSIRVDVLPLFDRSYPHVLDIGCANGATGALLKKQGLCSHVTGIEPFAPHIPFAQAQLDQVYHANIEDVLPKLPAQTFDCILCLDVLEHLVDPWTVWQRLPALLKPDGIVICSIPNVQHYSVSLPLVLFGHWRYTTAGLLDSSHLRFFTKEGIQTLLRSSSLKEEIIQAKMGRAARVLNRLSLGLWSGLLSYQYLTRSRK